MGGRGLVLLDFDGTITSRDTLFEFIRFTTTRTRFILGSIIVSPVLLLFKLRLLGNQAAKQRVLVHFFSDWPVAKFNQAADLFLLQRVIHIIRPGALEKIREYQKGQARVIVVSASPENWVKPWCDLVGIECIATKMEVKSSRITGRIEGLNCHGEEKVRRIKELLNLDEYEEIHAYGDTPSDRPMMALATQSFYKPFR